MSCDSGSSCGGLSVCGLGMAFGVTWALGAILFAIFAKFGYGSEMVNALGSIYWGYAATGKGLLYGVFWGFVDGFISGGVIAWIYNFCIKHCPCKCCVERRAAESKKK